jgi:hypothetical protein
MNLFYIHPLRFLLHEMLQRKETNAADRPVAWWHAFVPVGGANPRPALAFVEGRTRWCIEKNQCKHDPWYTGLWGHDLLAPRPPIAAHAQAQQQQLLRAGPCAPRGAQPRRCRVRAGRRRAQEVRREHHTVVQDQGVFTR